jgi:hypothetical protein
LRAIRSKLTYSNVIASIAMFLALTGGTVMAAKLGSSDLAANSVKKKQLAKSSVTSQDLAKKSLITKSATGGGQLVNVTAVAPATGFPLPLKGPTTFTPKKGFVGLLMAEVKATLSTIAPPSACSASVTFLVNGIAVGTLFVSDNPFGAPDPTGAPFTDVNSFATPIGLTGGPQKITAEYDGDSTTCSPASKLDQVRVVVQQTR